MWHLFSSDMVCTPHVCVSTWRSAQCRLEANYAHQQELDMIPLMMQKKYKPQGWRKSQTHSLHFLCRTSVIPLTCETSAAVGLIMGTRMWRVADHAMHSTLPVHCCCSPPFFFDCAPYYYSAVPFPAALCAFDESTVQCTPRTAEQVRDVGRGEGR